MPIDKQPGEDRDKFLRRCISKEVNSGKPLKQAVAICSSVFERSEEDDKSYHDDDDKKKKRKK